MSKNDKPHVYYVIYTELDGHPEISKSVQLFLTDGTTYFGASYMDVDVNHVFRELDAMHSACMRLKANHPELAVSEYMSHFSVAKEHRGFKDFIHENYHLKSLGEDHD